MERFPVESEESGMRAPGAIRAFCLALPLLLAIPLTAHAESAAPGGRWSFSVQPYLWLPSINGSLSHSVPPGGGGGANVEITTNQILEALNFVAMLEAEARKGKWALVTDFIYLDFGSQDSQVKSVDFSGPGGRVTIPATASGSASVELDGELWEFAGSYTVVRSEISSLDVLLGFRYFDLEATTKWDLTGTIAGPGPGQSFASAGSVTEGEDLWDGIVGIRGRLGLGSGKWGIPYYLDVGAGSSAITCQGAAGIQYRFSRIDLSLMYRYLYYDMESGDLLQDVSFAGPALGVNFRF
jgi:hypothetical protein